MFWFAHKGNSLPSEQNKKINYQQSGPKYSKTYEKEEITFIRKY